MIRKNIITSLIAAMGLFANCTAQEAVKTLQPKEFITAAKADSTAVILDVRRPDEFKEAHLDGAANLDWLNQASFRQGMATLDKSRTFYIYCRSGRRSNAAAMKMQAEGFKVVDMKGGILRWQELGMPVVK